MNMIALNTSTPSRQTKRATVKIKAPLKAKHNIEDMPKPKVESKAVKPSTN